jgi:anti-sigma B factor antagonist
VTAPIYTVHVEHDAPGPPTIVLEGELDLASRPEMQACFEGVLATGTAALNVDLAAVSFIDSAALGVVVDAFQELRDRDGQLTVTAASTSVIRTLEIAGLAPYLLPAGPDAADPD